MTTGFHITTIYDTDIRLSFCIEWGICYTTNTIRQVVFFIHTAYDTTRLYASCVLQVSTQLHNRVVTGSFGSDNLEAAAKYQAALKAKEELAALVTKSLQIELATKQAGYRDRLASSSSSDSSAYNTPAGSPDSTPVLKTKGKIKKNLDQVTNALSFSFARDSRLTRSTFKKKEGTGWPPKSSN